MLFNRKRKKNQKGDLFKERNREIVKGFEGNFVDVIESHEPILFRLFITIYFTSDYLITIILFCNYLMVF